MYQAPDFVKISAKVKDVFASYVSCIPDQYMIQGQQVGYNCESEQSMYYDQLTLDPTAVWQCYTTDHAPNP